MPHKEIVEDITGSCQVGYCTLREILNHIHEPVPQHDPRYGHCQNGGCPLRERVMDSGLDDRTLEQIKCLEIFKWHYGAETKKPIGWNHTIKLWVERGHAEAFGEIYKEGMKHKDLYTKIIYRNPLKLDL
jgi:hypothetical protein